MRGAPNVSEEKREAVTWAAEEIGYRPNAMARSLVRRRSFVIGVMVSDLHNPFFTEVVDGSRTPPATPGITRCSTPVGGARPARPTRSTPCSSCGPTAS